MPFLRSGSSGPTGNFAIGFEGVTSIIARADQGAGSNSYRTYSKSNSRYQCLAVVEELLVIFPKVSDSIYIRACDLVSLEE